MSTPQESLASALDHQASLETLQADMRRPDRLTAVQRATAGNKLAELGDPRFRPAAWSLPIEPLLGFVEIPPGPFSMGSDADHDPLAYADECPPHEIILPRYYIARYPVTVAQFRVFVEASGHQPENEGSRRGLPNHPAVWVSWLDALTYCEWLTARLRQWEDTPEPLATLLRHEGWRITLPSEPEWEKAARGTDGRTYPWGHEHDLNRTNCGGTGILGTSPVGCFAAGASPYGIEEMSGNAWEWTRSVWAPYPYPTDEAGQAAREYLEAREGVRRVRRGGAFFSSPRSVRCAVRLGSGPYPHGGGMGCRMVLRPMLPWRA